MRWFRVYDEVLDDPKIQRLHISLRWRWLELLCIASRQTERGTLPDITSIAFHFRVKEEEALRIIRHLVEGGLIHETGPSRWRIHAWDERQFKSDDVTSRWRKHKSNVCANVGANVGANANNPGANVGANGFQAPRARSEADSDTEKAAGIRADTPACAREGDPPPPPTAASFSQSRGEEDAADWREALNVIRERGESAHIADEIEASRDPRVTGMDGWRALVAAHALKKPGKAQTLAFFVRAGEKANTADLEAIEGKPGKPKPKPKAKRAVKSEPVENPLDPEEVRAEIAELEAMPRRRDWEETRLKLAKELLSSIGGMNGEHT